MKTVNLIFSIMFLIWAIDVLILCNTDSPSKKYYRFGFEERKFNFFWTLIVFATTFNIFARIFNQCNFYLVGAVGHMTLSLAEYFCSLYFIAGKLMGHPDMKSESDLQKRFYCFILPFLIFGLFSSLCCYQTKIKKRNDRNTSKLQQIFLRFTFITNQERVILIFNATYLLTGLTVFLVSIFAPMKFELLDILWFLLFIPSVTYFLACYFKKESFYRFALEISGFIAVTAILLCFVPFTLVWLKPEAGFDVFVEVLSVILIFTINTCIGGLSTLSLYRKKFKKEAELGKRFNDQSFKTAEDFDDNETEEGPSVKLFSNNVIIKL